LDKKPNQKSVPTVGILPCAVTLLWVKQSREISNSLSKIFLIKGMFMSLKRNTKPFSCLAKNIKFKIKF